MATLVVKNESPVGICSSSTPKRRTRATANHLMPHTKKAEPVGRMATEEEIEEFRRAEENFERGEYYSMLPNESLDDFLDRIESDPERWLECNLRKRRKYLFS